jgi:hypothetical protein
MFKSQVTPHGPHKLSGRTAKPFLQDTAGVRQQAYGWSPWLLFEDIFLLAAGLEFIHLGQVFEGFEAKVVEEHAGSAV